MVVKERTQRQEAFNRWQMETASERWRTAKALRDQGMTLRQIGSVMGVTYQRIGQMLAQLSKMEQAT